MSNKFPHLDQLDRIDTTDYPIICAWLSTVAVLNDPPFSVKEFEDYMEQDGYRVKYITEYLTEPDASGPGGRSDLLFALHKDDVRKMARDRLTRWGGEIKWFDDYRVNYEAQIPPEILTTVKY